MPGQFNPDKNLFSVAPVGPIVVIGRSISLRGGLSREYAMNLATWLLISCNATPKEIRDGVVDAMTPTVKTGKGQGTMPLPERTVPLPAPPKAKEGKASDVSAEVAGQVTPFIGTIDSEEAASLQEAVKATVTSPVTGLKIPVINPEDVASAWGGGDNGR